MRAYHGAAIASATSAAIGERTTRRIAPHGTPTTPHASATQAGTAPASGPLARRPRPIEAPRPTRDRAPAPRSASKPNHSAPAIAAASGMSIVTVREKPTPARLVAATPAAAKAATRP